MANKDIIFKDNSVQVKRAIEGAIGAFLVEASSELVSQTARNTRVGDGQLKSSWSAKINETKGEATIGSPLENAIWEEFGTGEYALEGNGRKTAWYIPVDSYMGKKKPTYQGEVVIVHGKGGKEFYKTDGKKPSRAFWNAYKTSKGKIIKRFETILKGKMDK